MNEYKTPMEEITKTQELYKILVTRNAYGYLFYKLGQYGIYVESIKPVSETFPSGNSRFMITTRNRGAERKPHIVVVRAPDHKTICDFITNEKFFQAFKIFKHGNDFNDIGDSARSLAANSVMNMMGLYPGKTFYIVEGNRRARPLVKLFYDMAVDLNEREGLGCKFDYDNYDLVLELRAYERENGKFSIISILYGDNLPNVWRSDSELPSASS